MPKTRAYTREELQGLRRADLQRLCKTYDIKGANAKSDVLINLLTQHFQSSAYDGEPSQRPPSRHVARPAGTHTLPTRPAAKSKNRSTPSSAPTAVRASGIRIPAQRATMPGGARAVTQAAGPQATVQLPSNRVGSKPPRPSSQDSEVEKLKTEIEQLKATVSRLDEQQSSMLMALLSREDFQHQLRSLIAAEIASAGNPGATVDNATNVISEPQPSFEQKSLNLSSSDHKSFQTKRKSEAPEASSCTSVKRPRRGSQEQPNTSATSHPPEVDGCLLAQHDILKTPQPFPHPQVPGRASRTTTAPPSATASPASVSKHATHDKVCTPSQSNALRKQGNLSDLKSPFGTTTARIENICQGLPSLAKTPNSGSGIARAFAQLSPAREYMDVALNGLSGHCASSNTVPIPSVRTLLGTERYRDTRFGDEPIVPWGTPTAVDFGPPTPVRDGVL